MLTVVSRVQNALPSAKILLMSPMDCAWCQDTIDQYRSKSLPLVASQLGVQYWDMGSWFGPTDTARFFYSTKIDTNVDMTQVPYDTTYDTSYTGMLHVNDNGGRIIADTLRRQIEDRFGPFDGTSTAITRAVHNFPPDAVTITGNGSLIITLSQPASVRFRVYDVNGRVVYSTDNADAKGVRRISWNGFSKEGGHLPAGIYLCKVALANKTISARVTIIP